MSDDEANRPPLALLAWEHRAQGQFELHKDRLDALSAKVAILEAAAAKARADIDGIVKHREGFEAGLGSRIGFTGIQLTLAALGVTVVAVVVSVIVAILSR